MNLPQTENPDLTAYTLGELDARHAAQIHGMLHISPGGAAEFREIEAIANALSQHAPVPNHRLHPAQRHAVQNPAGMPRKMSPMQPRPMPARRPTLWPVFASILRAAAVIAITSAAFWMGKNSALESNPATALTLNDVQMPSPLDEPKPELLISSPRPALTQIEAPSAQSDLAFIPPDAPPAVGESDDSAKLIALPAPETLPVNKAADILAESVLAEAKPDMQLGQNPSETPPVAPAPRSSVTRPAIGSLFISTTKQTLSQYAMRPAEIRPAPPRTSQARAFASPLPAKPAATKTSTPAKSRPPELFIHSWKAEVAACPWNTAHRLLRIVIQLPADQPATTQPFTYPLEVTFDPNNVREYRQLCERHVPAEELRRAGTHSFWYEFLPNGKTDANKTIASITLPQVRFTTQTVGPFDGSKLLVQDRGLDWQAAREDFIFDTAVVGFSMLLRGVGHSANLDHKLVLALAEKSLVTDSRGERQRFVRQVREAQKAAGL